MIVSQIERCRKIIKDLLNFSRAPGTDLDVKGTNLNELIERCLSLTEKEIESRGINLIKSLADIPQINVDPSRISQVFFNIIINAIQAMSSGGRLTVKSRYRSGSSYSRKTTQYEGEIRISFSDTGIGIPKEILSEIFNPFFTTKAAGTGVGLGLSVAYEIVNLFDGKISVDSKEGEGTTFTVILPVME
jgi:signal transduction histidine kinase